MKIILSLNVPELDAKDRELLADKISQHCTKLSLTHGTIINNGASGSLDLDVSRLKPEELGVLTAFARNTLKSILNLDL